MFIFLETNKVDKENGRNYLFEDPVEIISCKEHKEIERCFCRMEALLKKGYYLAGFISYEAGGAFEETLAGHKKHAFPLLWFGAFGKPRDVGQFKRKHGPFNIRNLRLNQGRGAYSGSIKKIKKLIEKGDTYQVNYTLKYKFNFSGHPSFLYNNLKEKQPVSYSAYIDTGEYKILSFSPELFFRKNREDIIVRPMKGTAARGRNISEDESISKFLKEDVKNRSENIMIVDLMRSDLGRIARAGSVRTVSLFDIEKYKTLFQMTSKVKAKTERDISLHKLFSSIFPSGSVTGAPKIRTMQIIKELEREERKIYTGAIGFIAPDRDMVFNVAIRTILLNGRRGEMGIGSGIVYDSDPDKEYDECLLKADFLTKKAPAFELIETILFNKNKYYLLKGHVERMEQSARYFDFNISKQKILKALRKFAKRLEADKKYRVRLLLDRAGKIKISHDTMEKPELKERPKIAAFSKKTTSSSDVFLFHKTTNRALYDGEHKKYRKKGFYDVIFENEKGEVTEGAISNIFIKKAGRIYTPPIKCGLLNGIYRQHFIRNNRSAGEKILRRKDILDADEVYLCNSVRGMITVKVTD